MHKQIDHYRPTQAIARMVAANRNGRTWRQYGEDTGIPFATLHAIAHRRPGACSKQTAEQIRLALRPAWLDQATDILLSLTQTCSPS